MKTLNTMEAVKGIFTFYYGNCHARPHCGSSNFIINIIGAIALEYSARFV
jgi:hypothetical protein